MCCSPGYYSLQHVSSTMLGSLVFTCLTKFVCIVLICCSSFLVDAAHQQRVLNNCAKQTTPIAPLPVLLQVGGRMCKGKCPPGMQPLLNTCVNCPAGTINPGLTATPCTKCGLGSAPALGSASCTLCEPGKAATVQGEIAFWTDALSAPMCSPLSAGTFVYALLCRCMRCNFFEDSTRATTNPGSVQLSPWKTAHKMYLTVCAVKERLRSAATTCGS
jgi:hypothetical protein